MLGTSRTADILIHQRPTKIVGSRSQNLLGALNSDLHPRHLDVVDEPVVRDSTHAVHQQCFSKSWPSSGLSLEVDRACHVHKWQRDPLGEATRTLLKFAGPHDVVRPMTGFLYGPEHDGDIRMKANRVSCLMAFQPLSC